MVEPVEQIAKLADQYGVLVVLLAVVCTLLLLLAGFLIWQAKASQSRNDKMVDRLFTKMEEEANKRKVPHTLKDTKEDVAEIYIKLGKALETGCAVCHNKIGADRVAVYSLHNGTVGISGFPFIKMDCVAEWTALPQLQRRIDLERNMSTLPLASFLGKIHEEGSVFVENITTLKEEFPAAWAMLAGEGDHAVALVAVKTLKGRVIGYIKVEWKTRKPPENMQETCIAPMQDLAEQVATILQITTFEEMSEYTKKQEVKK